MSGRGEGAARLCLIGPPGAGKTSVGRALAALLGWDFVDTDELVAAGTGESPEDLFVDRGEAAYLERQAGLVRGLLATPPAAPQVVALGSAAPLEEATARLIDPARTVFLDVGDQEGIRRAGLDAPHPALGFAPRALWRIQMAARRPRYAALAAHRVVTDGRAPADVARDLATLVKQAGRTGGER
ncbi:MAG: AAA family ATPase [Bifidobacteriaceae bacterium]|nr:AAA family ATPase [Bifidobacteriaceae bacterium]